MTNINISLDHPFRVAIGKGEYGVAMVEWEKFNQTVQDYIYAYGLRKILNDTVSDKTDKKTGAPQTPEVVFGRVQDKLAAMYAGEVRIRGEGESGDPVIAEFAKEARKTVMAQLNKIKVWDKCPKKTENRFMWAVNFMRAKADKELFADEAAYWAYFADLPIGKDLMAQAAATVAERASRVEEATIEMF